MSPFDRIAQLSAQLADARAAIARATGGNAS